MHAGHKLTGPEEEEGGEGEGEGEEEEEVVPTENFVVIEHTRMSRCKIVKCRSCTRP